MEKEVKDYICVNGSEYFEGVVYTPECADDMGCSGFDKNLALRMTEEEAKDICTQYKGFVPVKLTPTQ